jgi:hypothetical protein
MSHTHIPIKLRQRIAEQAKHRCGYCYMQEAVVGSPMEIDHIVPEALGGVTVEGNLWLACSFCNSSKGVRVAALDPVTGEMVALFNPRTQSWPDHFVWAGDGTMIAGRTPTGRATVVALRLNRMPLVRAREMWVKAGWHPPE